MPAWHETAWSVDGVPLQTAARNVESLEGKYGLPALRGTDDTVAYGRGTVWRPKYPDSRTVSLGMWVNGNDPATGVPAADPARQFHANMVALERLLWTDGERQIDLAKKWRDPLTGEVVQASAAAEVAGGLAVTMDGPHVARCTVDFVLSDPYFYAPTITSDVTGSLVLEVPGDVPTEKIVLSFGESVNATLNNARPTPDHWVKLGSTVAAGDAVVLDVAAFSATRTSDGANLIGAVSRAGGRRWARLYPGVNNLSSSSGTVSITYAPAYL